jgi:hypothetical protein
LSLSYYLILQSTVDAIVSNWVKPKGAIRQRNVVELLNTISEVVALLAENDFATSSTVKNLDMKTSSFEEVIKLVLCYWMSYQCLNYFLRFDQVRKCYMQIVRVIHPDKISGKIYLLYYIPDVRSVSNISFSHQGLRPMKNALLLKQLLLFLPKHTTNFYHHNVNKLPHLRIHNFYYGAVRNKIIIITFTHSIFQYFTCS